VLAWLTSGYGCTQLGGGSYVPLPFKVGSI
jgi:hypothetical protein